MCVHQVKADFDQCKKETLLAIEFGYTTYEASGDNLDAHIYMKVSLIKFILLLLFLLL